MSSSIIDSRFSEDSLCNNPSFRKHIVTPAEDANVSFWDKKAGRITCIFLLVGSLSYIAAWFVGCYIWRKKRIVNITKTDKFTTTIQHTITTKDKCIIAASLLGYVASVGVFMVTSKHLSVASTRDPQEQEKVLSSFQKEIEKFIQEGAHTKTTPTTEQEKAKEEKDAFQCIRKDMERKISSELFKVDEEDNTLTQKEKTFFAQQRFFARFVMWVTNHYCEKQSYSDSHKPNADEKRRLLLLLNYSCHTLTMPIVSYMADKKENDYAPMHDAKTLFGENILKAL